jgi:hypothetical protein
MGLTTKNSTDSCIHLTPNKNCPFKIPLGGEMAQTLYAHINKRKIIINKIPSKI